MLDLVEHYRWSIFPQEGEFSPPVWAVETDAFVVFGPTVREAISNALSRQASDALAANN